MYSILRSMPGYVYWKDINSVYMGCNEKLANLLGLADSGAIIGSTDYNLPWGVHKEILDRFLLDDKYVIQNGNSLVIDETVLRPGLGDRIVILRMEKAPLIDKNGVIIGVIVVAMDITARKEAEYSEIDLDFIHKFGPGHIYWKDLDSVYLGCNKNLANLIGLNDSTEVIGMSEHEMPWAITRPETVIHNIRADRYVIETGDMMITEEDVGIKNANGLSVILRSEKRPLINKKGEVIGVLGISVDITDAKEAERLNLENVQHKAAIHEQQKFRKLVEQVVHDIRSPLAAMNMVLPQCDDLPEKMRNILRLASTRIRDIANNMLSQVKSDDDIGENENSGLIPSLVCAAVTEIVTEKSYEYANLSIQFNLEITQAAYFAFIKIDERAFKRMLSNLMNNAVDAFEDKSGNVVVHMDVIEDDQLRIIVEDHGIGMSDSVKEKILNNEPIRSGKVDGNGIGFSQIWDTLLRNGGKLAIDSEKGKGTKIILTFPLAAPENWVCTQIALCDDDLVVILDDDKSIHGAWEAKFDKESSSIKRKHFESGAEAIEFINSLSSDAKEKLFLLTDYELLRQGLTGLDVVYETNTRRSVLVTSHHNNQEVRDHAKELQTRILPKVIAAEIPIHIVDRSFIAETVWDSSQDLDGNNKQVDLVIVNDDTQVVDVLQKYVLKNKHSDVYSDIDEFLQNVERYPKDTKIMVSQQFIHKDVDSFAFLDKLYNLEYTKLYLYADKNEISNDILPDYLQVIDKINVDELQALLNQN